MFTDMPKQKNDLLSSAVAISTDEHFALYAGFDKLILGETKVSENIIRVGFLDIPKKYQDSIQAHELSHWSLGLLSPFKRFILFLKVCDKILFDTEVQTDHKNLQDYLVKLWSPMQETYALYNQLYVAYPPDDLKNAIEEFLIQNKPETFKMLMAFHETCRKFWNRCKKPSIRLLNGLTYSLARATTLMPINDFTIPYKSPLIRFNVLYEIKENKIRKWNNEGELVSFLKEIFRNNNLRFYSGDAVFSERIENVIESLSFWHFFRESTATLGEESLEPLLYSFLCEFDYFYHPIVYYYSIRDYAKRKFAISFLPSGKGLPPDYIKERLAQLSITKDYEISEYLNLDSKEIAKEWLKEYRNSLIGLRTLRNKIIQETKPTEVKTKKFKKTIIKKLRKLLSAKDLSYRLIFPTIEVEKCTNKL
jgi:hypothetical protein